MSKLLTGKLTTLFILLFVMVTAWAQPTDERTRVDQFKQDSEQQRKVYLLSQMDSGVYLMENGRHEEAEKKFKLVLDNIKGVPSDLTFFFGKNSFYLEKFKQSIDWLNKYIQLKGTNGQYSQEATTIKAKAEAEYLKEKSHEIKKATEVLSVNYDIDCGPSGLVTCPVCKGDHVIVKKAAFGDEYKTCGYCNKHGLLTCDEYNQLLRGELKPKQ
jgi:tetratricopeptide (TPR) repeat protein